MLPKAIANSCPKLRLPDAQQNALPEAAFA
jgi:hypothetical protein